MSQLFQPNNHSAWQVVWSDVDEAQAEKVREFLRIHYGWEQVTDIKKSGAWEVQSKNFRVTIDEHGTVRTVLVKKNPSGHTEGRLLFVEHALAYLKEQNLPVPEILPTQNQERHVSFDGANWQVFTFMPGDYFQGTEAQLQEVAKWIARLHVVLREGPLLEEALAHGKAAKPWSVEAFAGLFEIASKKNDEISHLLTSERVFLEEMIRQLVSKKQDMAGAKRQVVRNSLHPHDVLFEGERLSALIDFEELGENELVRDVGSACHRFVRQYVVHQSRPWQETLRQGVRIFLDAYQQDNPLAPEEMRLMPLFIQDELLRKLESAIKKIATQEKPGTYEAEAAKFIALLHEAAYVKAEIDTLAN